MSKLSSFLKLSNRRKVLFFYTIGLSIYVNLKMRFLNSKSYFISNNAPKVLDENLARDISWAIFKVDKMVFWENVCRHQAYQAMILCDKYEIPYEIFIGFRKNEENREIEAHAWTYSGSLMITGFCQPEEYTVQQVFRG